MPLNGTWLGVHCASVVLLIIKPFVYESMKGWMSASGVAVAAQGYNLSLNRTIHGLLADGRTATATGSPRLTIVVLPAAFGSSTCRRGWWCPNQPLLPSQLLPNHLPWRQ